MIGGLIVDEEPKGVSIVAQGPSLGAAGVPNPVQNSKVELFLGGQLLASNDNWRDNGNAAESQRRAQRHLTIARQRFSLL